MSVFIDSLRGKSATRGHLETADSIGAFEFSRREPGRGVGQPNLDLAYILDGPELAHLPLFTGQTITQSLLQISADKRPSDIFIGDSAQGVHENTGTEGEIEQMLSMLKAADLHHPILLTSIWNASNVLRQTRKQTKGSKYPINPIVLGAGYRSRSFDPESMQWWTRSAGMWRLGVVPRLVIFKLKSH